MGKKVSEFNSLTEVTDGDLFMVTDDTTGDSRKVAWSAVKTSIPETDLDDLDSVDVTTAAPVDGSALVYDSASSKWVPGTISDVDGHNPQKGVRYKYQSSTSPSGIGSGVVRFNSTVPASTNVMYLRDTDRDGIDHTSMLSVLFQQNTVFVLRSNSNTSHYVKFAVSGNTTDMGNYFTVPVRHIESVAYPSNNSDATFTNATQLYALEGAQDFTLPENTADAIDFVQGDDSYIKIDTTTSTKKITVGQDLEVDGNTTLNGTLTLPDADITFQDNNGTYPTSGKGFYWDLNTDGAYIYAYQSANDYIDLVFKVIDNTNNQNDRWVFWLDSYQGQSTDSFPLTMTADHAYFFCDPSSTDGKPNVSNWQIRIDSDGNLRTTPTSSVTPTKNGEFVVEATNNTTLTFKLKGSDGVVRTGTLTLS